MYSLSFHARRSLQLLLLTLVVVYVAALESFSYSEIVMIPGELFAYSSDSAFVFKAECRLLTDPTRQTCKGTLFRRQSGHEDILIWQRSLPYDFCPGKTLITKNGAFVITVDDYFESGRGDSVIVVYDAKGMPKYAYAMRDVVTDRALTSEAGESLPDIQPAVWGRVDTVDEARHELVLHVNPRLQQIPEHPFPDEIRIDLMTGKVRSKYAVVGRPLPPSKSSRVQLVGVHRMRMPDNADVAGADVDVSLDRNFLLLAATAKSDGGKELTLQKIDTLAQVLWEWRKRVFSAVNLQVLRMRGQEVVGFTLHHQDSLGRPLPSSTELYCMREDGAELWHRSLEMTELIALTNYAVQIRVYFTDLKKLWPAGPTMWSLSCDGEILTGKQEFNRSGHLLALAPGVTCYYDRLGVPGLLANRRIQTFANVTPHRHMEAHEVDSLNNIHVLRFGFDSVVHRERVMHVGKGVQLNSAVSNDYGGAVVCGQKWELRDPDFFVTRTNYTGDSLWTFEYGSGSPSWAMAAMDKREGRISVAGFDGGDFVIFDLTEPW